MLLCNSPILVDCADTFSGDDLADMLQTGLTGSLKLLALDGQQRVPIGLFSEIDYVPTRAQYLSLVSSDNEIRGFAILKSANARSVALAQEPSFEICSQAGETALVFVTEPSVDVADITSFFRRTFSFDRHNYRICFDLPFPKDGWFMMRETVARLRSEGCKILGFADPCFAPKPTIH